MRQLRRNRLVGFEPSQNKGRRDALKLLGRFFIVLDFDGLREGVLKARCGAEKPWVGGFHDGPVFHEPVFHGRAAHRNDPVSLDGTHALKSGGAVVFDGLGFIQNEKPPGALRKRVDGRPERAVGREHCVHRLFFTGQRPARAVVDVQFKFRRKARGFSLPVGDK